MGKADETDIASDLRAALYEGASTRSPLFIWMLRNHDMLVETFIEARPNWTRVTELLMSRGFSSTDGKPLNPQSVRQMWFRVRRRHAAIQSASQFRPAPSAEEETAPTQAHPAPTPEMKGDNLSPQELIDRVKAEMAIRSGRKP
jgi:hypothetical protein